MSKGFPDRHPKLKGDHGLLPAFRKWFQKCEKNGAIVSIIPSETKRDQTHSTPEGRWKRVFGPVKFVKESQEPVASVTLVYGALSQEVTIFAKNREALQAVGLLV